MLNQIGSQKIQLMKSLCLRAVVYVAAAVYVDVNLLGLDRARARIELHVGCIIEHMREPDIEMVRSTSSSAQVSRRARVRSRTRERGRDV